MITRLRRNFPRRAGFFPLMSKRPQSPLVLVAVVAGLLIGGSATLATGATTPETTPPTTPASTPNPTPPVVLTGGAESVTNTDATLTGAVTPNDAETHWRFEYGTSTSYGLSTTETTVPPGDQALAARRAVTGLTAGTTYHYRLVATNAAGTSRGADKTFVSTGSPKAPSATTLAQVAVTATGATLVGRVNPGGQATNYFFQYGTSTSYRSRTATASAGAGRATATFQVPIAGLAANTKYHYRVVATNATGTSRGADRTFTTSRSLTGVTIGATPAQANWNSSITVRGTVAGKGNGGIKVALMRQSFPYTTPAAQVAVQTTSSAGAYAFTVGPLYAGVKLQVITQTAPTAASPVITVNNALFTKLRISQKTKRTARLRGQVFPAVTAARATVQRRSPKGRWIKVKRAKLRKVANVDRVTYSVSVPRLARRTAYRVVILPRDGGAHVTTTTKIVSVAKR